VFSKDVSDRIDCHFVSGGIAEASLATDNLLTPFAASIGCIQVGIQRTGRGLTFCTHQLPPLANPTAKFDYTLTTHFKTPIKVSI
jgi:hypothetical protein